MRGVPAARYQGTRVAALQGQLTWQLMPRWRLLGFVGAGRVAASSSDLGSAPSVISQGVGFRYLIARRYDINMGVDIARGPEDTAFYIQVGTGF